MVQEDVGFIQHVKTFFVDQQNHPTPKPALSEHSTSNPAISSDNPRFQYSPQPPSAAALARPEQPNPDADDNDEDDEDEEDDEDHDEAESDSEAGIGLGDKMTMPVSEPSELMQVEMSEDIRLGSPDDGSNNLESDFHLLAVSRSHHNHPDASFLADSGCRLWPHVPDPGVSLPPSGLEDASAQEDTHYSETVSTILHNQTHLWSEPSSSSAAGHVSTESAFTSWTSSSDHDSPPPPATSQWLLKYVLFSVPYLHAKYRDENSPKSGEAAARAARRGGGAQDELSANHVLAERRRREKLNERFVILRSLVPFVTKMDKASILGDTIEYVKQLRKKVQDLEASDKRKVRIIERSCGSPRPARAQAEPTAAAETTSVQVSIIEAEGLLELQCPYREGLLLEVMQILRDLRIETRTVQSSLNDNGVFVAEIRAKVKENVNGKKASIVEVKKAINQIIPHRDS